jgi:hypothetical protein
MNRLRQELVTSSKTLRRNGIAAARRWEATTEFWQNDYDGEPAEEWSLSLHSPGQEPRCLRFEELARLQREAGDADSLYEELTS